MAVVVLIVVVGQFDFVQLAFRLTRMAELGSHQPPFAVSILSVIFFSLGRFFG